MGAAKEKTGELRIIAADTYWAAAEAAIKEIDPRERTVVLVPDSYTLQAERLVLKQLNLKGSFNVFVNSFDRLFYFLCGEAKPMPATSAVMLLQKIISENAKKLKCFFRSAEFPGFAEKIYGVITKLKSNGVTPGALENRGAEGALGKKLADISFLYEKYEEERGGAFLDSNDRAAKLARFIAGGRAPRYNVVLAGFASLTKAEAGIIRQFLLSGCPVTAAVTYRENHNAYTNEIYGGLSELAAGIRIKPRTVFLAPARRAAVFRHLYDNLDRRGHPGPAMELKNNAVTVTNASGVCAEVRKAAEMITVYTRRGYRYRDIAVICPEIERYIPAIEGIFAEYGISFFLSAPQPLALHPFYSYITAAAEAVLKGYALSDMLVFLKNPYFGMHGVSGRDINIFENYCLRRGIDRNGFFREFALGGEGERDPFDRKRKDEERDRAEAVRLKLVKAVRAFSDIKTGNDCAALIETLLAGSGDITAQLIAAAEYRAAEALRQGGAGFMAVAGETARIFGDAPVSLRRFCDVFKRGCGLYALNSIPETQDCVIIGGPEVTRMCPPGILFILNACEDSLPLRETDCGIINDADIEELKAEGIACVPSVRSENLRAYAEIFQAAVSPRSALHVSYPAQGADGKPRNPAQLVNSLCALFTRNGAPLAPYNENYDVFGLETADKKKAARLAAGIYACNDKVALRSLSVLTGLYRDSGGTGGTGLGALYRSLVLRGKIKGDGLPRAYKPPAGKIAEARGLFFYKDSTKVSQIESFYSCPYAHFLCYGLRLKERPEAGPDGANIGTLLHAVLERFMKDGMKRGGGAVFDEVADLPEYADIKNTDNAPLFKRLRKESEKVCAVLKEQQAFSSFKPSFFELDFPGRGAPAIELGGSGEHLKISGKIDRVDIAVSDGRQYARVIDYKTGVQETKLTYGGLSSGESLQLLVYLAYLRAAGYAPAGAFYFKVHDTQGDYRMNGVVNKENGLPAMMDFRLNEPGFKSDIINMASTKSGDCRKSPYAVDQETLCRLCDYAIAKMDGAAARIGEGECAVSPYRDACKFCTYGGICLFDPDKDEARKGGKTVRTAEELLEG